MNNSQERQARRGGSNLREKREQTKFDKWLEEKQRTVEKVTLVLDPSPYQNDELEQIPVLIVAVDRYMICVEFQHQISEHDGATWWIPKDSIKGAS